MDMLAHALWAGAGLAVLRRRPALRPALGTALGVGAVAASVLPDLMQGLPVLAWSLAAGQGLATVQAFALAAPGAEQALPVAVEAWSHHLHCIAHSAPIAAVALAAAWAWARALWPLLAGWWLHIAIDVLTHSADFYPVPVLYPFTMRGFDGIAWNTPWFAVANYAALAVAWAAIALTRRR
jgi:hypothetical protein